jgi:hypothetical protein
MSKVAGGAATAAVVGALAQTETGRRRPGGSGMFRAFPLMIVPVVLYNLFALMAGGGAADSLAHTVFTVPMPMNSQWTVSWGDLLLILALVMLFFELVRATNAQKIEIINHSLSLVLFIGCLVEFLLVPGFQTSVFFLISLMALSDVLAGFIVTIVSSKREIDIAR